MLAANSSVTEVSRSSLDAEIANIAEEREGWNSTIYTATVYLLTNSARQNLIIVETTEDRPGIKPFNFSIIKSNKNGNAVSGAEISLTGGAGVDTISSNSATSNSSGSFGTFEVMPTSNSGTATIYVKETKFPAGYMGYEGDYTLSINYNDGEVISMSISPSTAGLSTVAKTSGDTLEIINYFDKIEIPIKKIDVKNRIVPGAVIKVTKVAGVDKLVYKQNGTNICSDDDSVTVTSDANGNFNLFIIPEDISGSAELIIEEMSAPYPYDKMAGEVKLNVSYSNGKVDSISYTPSTTDHIKLYDSNKKVYLVNHIKPIELIFVKEDENGKRLGAGYQFKLKLSENLRIHADKTYVQQDKYAGNPNVYILEGTEFYLKTDANGEIHVTIYPKDLEETTVQLIETDGNFVFDKIDGSVVINLEEDKLESSDDCITIKGTGVEGSEIHIKENPMPLILDLSKIDRITKEGVDGVKFSVVLKKEGATIFSKTLTTKDGGKIVQSIKVADDETSVIGNNFELVLTESTPAPGYDTPSTAEKVRTVKFHYENNNGIGSYVIDKVMDGNGAEIEKNQANFEGKTLNVIFPNEPIHTIEIEKKFYNDIETDITEYVKENLLTEDDTVRFELEFAGITAKINAGTNRVTHADVNLGKNNNIIKVKDIKLSKTNPLNFGLIKIKETKTVDGFEKMLGSRIFVVARVKNDEHKWILVKWPTINSNDASTNGYDKITLDNIRTDTIPLTIEKVDARGDKVGAGYEFTVTIPNSDKIKINKRYVQEDKYNNLPEGDNIELFPDGDKYYLVTASDSNIDLEISPKSGVTTLNVTIEETEPGNNLFKTVTGTLKIVRNANGTMSLTSDSTNVIEVVSDNKIKVHEQNEDIVLHLTKVNDLGKKIEGAKAKVELMVVQENGETLERVYDNSGNKITIGEFTSGKIDITPYIRRGLSQFELFVTEIEAPNGYKAEDAIVVFNYENNNGNVKYNITQKTNSKAVFDESEENQLKLNVNIENKIDDLDIKIEKLFLDKDGQDITTSVVNNKLPKSVDGKAVVFDITFEGCTAIIDGEDEANRIASNNTQSVGLGTDDNYININNIKLNEGSTQGTIKVKETVTLAGYDLIEEEMLFYVTRDANNNYVYKLESAKEYEDVTVNNSTKTITITNRQSLSVWYGLELLKTDPQGNPVGSGYAFNVNVEEAKYLLTSGKYLKPEAKSIYTHIPYVNVYIIPANEIDLVTVDSKIELIVIPDTDRDLTRESAITISETDVVNKIFGTINANLKVKHNSDNLMDVTITSNDTNVAELTTRRETEGTETVVINVAQLTEKVELSLELIKETIFGTTLDGAKANVSLKAYNDEQNREVYTKVVDNFGDFSSEKIDVTSCIKDGLTNFELVVNEIKAPEGYKVLEDSITAKFHYEYSDGASKFIMDSENAKIDEDVPNKVIVEVVNEPEINIDLKKEFVNPKDEVIPLESIAEYTRIAQGEEVVFDIKLENCQAKIAGDTELSSEKTVTLNHENDFNVGINEIELRDKTKLGKIIVKETRTLNGYTYYSEEMEFYVGLDKDAPKGYILTSSKYEYARIEDTTIIVTNKQDVKYPVTIKKVDTQENSLGEGYKFTVTVEEAKYIEVDEKYIQNTEGLARANDGYKYIIAGTEFNLQTDKNGEIKFVVYPDSSKDLTQASNIILKETEAGSNVFEVVETGAKVEHNAVNGIVTIAKKDAADVNLEVEGNNTLKVIEDLKDLKLDITKVIGKKDANGAKFDITLSADGKEPIKYNDVEVVNGKLEIENINITSLIGSEITLTLVETKGADGGKPVPVGGITYIVKFEYRNEEGNAKYVITEDNGNIVLEKEKDGSIEGTELKLKVENTPVTNIPINKKFYDKNGNDITGSTAVNAGDVLFNITFNGLSGVIDSQNEASRIVSGTTAENIDLGADKLINVNLVQLEDIDKPGTITVQETKTLPRFGTVVNTMTFTVELKEDGSWDVKEELDYSNVEVNENNSVTIINNEFEDDITLVKQDEVGNPIDGIKFILDIEQIQECKINGITYTADGTGKVHIDDDNVKTKDGGKIIIKDILTGNTEVTVAATESLTETQKETFKQLEPQTKTFDLTKDEEMIMVAENEIIPYPLTIEKVDPLENKLGKGYVFDISMTDVEKIEVQRKYIDGSNAAELVTLETQPYTLQTDSNGQIKIEKVYANSLYTTITLDETQVGSTVFTLVKTGAKTEYNAEDGKIVLEKLNADDINIKVEGNDKVITVLEDLNDELQLDLSKTVDKLVAGKDAEFDVKLEVKGTEFYNVKHKTDLDGNILESLDIKELLEQNSLTVKDYLENEVTLTLVETKAPKGAKQLETPVTYIVKYHYENNNGNAKYVISSETIDGVELQSSKYFAKFDETKLNKLVLTIDNEINPVGLTIEKTFVNAAGTDITEETKANANRVKFDIEFRDSTAIVDGMERDNKFENVVVGTDCKVNVEDIKLNSGKTSGTIVITEKETIDGFEKITDEMEFTLNLDEEGRLVITPNSNYKFAKVDNDINTIKITNKKSYELVLQKVDTDGAILGEGYEFAFQIDNARRIKVAQEYVQTEEYGALTPVDGYYTIGAINGIGYYYLKTDSNGKIEIAEIYGDAPAIITVYEQDPGSNLVKKIDGDIALTVTEDADKNIVYSTSNINSYVENNVIYIKNEPIINLNLLKISEAGKFLSNAGFNIKMIAPDEEVVINRDGVTGENGEISIEDVNLGKYIKANPTVFRVEITETAVPQGHEAIKLNYTFNLKYKVENGIPSYTIENDEDRIATLEKTGRIEYIGEEPVYIEGERVTYTENKNTIYLTIKNKEIVPSLNIEKVFKNAAGRNITNDVKSQANNVKFNITFEGATARVDSSLRGATFTNVVLGEDCNIDVTDIMLDEGKINGKMFVKETATIEGFEKLIKTIEFKLEINSDKELTITKVDNNNNNIKVDNTTITIENVKSYPLTIEKVDPNGDVLGTSGKEYEFSVEIDGARGIELQGKYVQGKSGNALVQLTEMPYTLKTVNGRIEIAKVYADIPGTIRLTETKTGNKVTKAITQEMIVNASSDSDANIVFSTTDEKLGISENSVQVENDIYVNTNLKKVNENGTVINGAIFTVNMKAGEEYVKDKDGVDIKDRKITLGTKLLSDINMSDYADKEITLTLHEDYVPELYEEPETRDYEVKFRYVNNSGVPKYEIISGTDIASYNETSNTINVTITNKTKTWDLVIEKLFKNLNGNFVTENPNNVELHVEFSGFTAIIDEDDQYVSSGDIEVGNDNIININNIKFTNASNKKGTIKIKEIVGQQGYRKLLDEFQFAISIDKNGSLVVADSAYDNAIVDNFENKISIINSKVYPLKIEKYDSLGNKLKADFEFTVELADTDKIVVNKKYVNTDNYTVEELNEVSGVCTLEGNKFYLKTDSNGDILIDEIHGAIPSAISIEETKSPNPLFGLVSGNVSISYGESGLELYSLSEPTIRVDNSRSIKAIKVYNELKPLTMNLFKYALDNEGNKVPQEGATFRISMTYQKDGTTNYVKDTNGNPIIDSSIERFTGENGEFTLENIDVTDLIDKEITATLKEYQEPENAEEPEVKTFTVVFKYNYNSGSPKYNVVNHSENCEASFDGNTLKLEVENKKLPKLTIEKHFIDKYGDDVTQSIRRNKLVTGNEVKFKITLNNCDALVEGTRVTSGNSTEVGLGVQDNFIFIKDIEIKSGKTATVKVQETATLEGYVLNSTEMEFTIILEDDLNWNVTENYSNVSLSSDKKIVIIDNYEEDDDGLFVNLNVTKEGNAGEKISDVPFKVNVKSGSVYLKDATGKEIKDREMTTVGGVFSISGIDIRNYKDKNITVTIEETATPAGYVEKDNKVTTVVCKYNSTTKQLEKISSSNCKEANCYANAIDVTILNIKKLPDIKLIKVDNLNNIVEEAEFKIKLEGAKSLKANGTTKNSPSTEFTVKTDANGFINLTEIVPANITSASEIKLTATEINAPSGLRVLSKPVEVTYSYNPSTGKITNLTDNYTIDDVTVRYIEAEDVIEVKAIDYIDVDLTLTKEDNRGNKLSNVEFTLDFGGAVDELTVQKECVKGYGEAGSTVKILKKNLANTTFVTNSSGQIVLTDIILNKATATLKVTEKTTPTDSEGNTYKRINKVMNYKITYNPLSHVLSVDLTNGTTKVSISDNSSVPQRELKDLTNASCNGNKINMKVINIPIINLSGKVWLDGQKGDKVTTPPDGFSYNDKGRIAGVNVYLYNKDIGEIIASTTTNNKGEYTFKGYEKAEYIILFEYNGIKYEETGEENPQARQEIIAKGIDPETVNSDAKEEAITNEYGRDSFNSRFKTIGKDVAQDAYGNVTANLTYSYPDDTRANLQGEVDGCNGTHDEETYEGNFKVRAATAVYSKTTKNIDLGLVERYFDLSLSNYAEEVKYEINGVTDIITAGENAQNYYDAIIYQSDYTYRFDDYVGNVRFGDEVVEEFTRNDIMQKELEITVKYNLRITNNSGIPAEKALVKYTFDDKYEYIGITGASAIRDGRQLTIEVTDFNQDIAIEFKLRKDNDVDRNLILGETVNTAEIISYTTETGGYIDCDSAPDNNKQQEDDQNSYTVNFELSDTAREISGNVAEANREEIDGITYGILNNNNINDVIVQLVEIVYNEDNGYYYEYIWQETKTGSREVKALARKTNPDDTLHTYTYQNNLPESNIDGKYQFLSYSATAGATDENGKHYGTSLKTGYIPGNYIVRFIYGDGTTYDISPATKKYNGQDYKSTVNPYYYEKWYNKVTNEETGELETKLTDSEEGWKYKENASVAIDNEARRLEVMAYSTQIDGSLGEALNIINKDSYSALNSKEKELIDEYFEKLVALEESGVQKLTAENITDLKEEENFIIDLKAGKLGMDAYTTALDGFNNDQKFEFVQKYVLYRTWMAADTSLINVRVEASKYEHVNLGLELRPKTKLVLEKHITGMTLSTNAGTPLVNAQVQNKDAYLIDGAEAETQGQKAGLSTIRSTRGNRGFWQIETDIDELAQGATVRVQYTYVIKNESDEDYLGKDVVNAYNEKSNGEYVNALENEFAGKVWETVRNYGYNFFVGEYLSQFYYTGKPNNSKDKKVITTVEKFEEYLNSNLKVSDTQEDSTVNKTHFSYPDNVEEYKVVVYSDAGIAKDTKIKTTKIENEKTTSFEAGGSDTTRELWVSTVLSSAQQEVSYPSYITQITLFSNAAGRKDSYSAPANLTYIHSDDNTMTLDAEKVQVGTVISYVSKTAADVLEAAESLVSRENINELDEFWGETITVRKPTGEDKSFPVQIVIITTSSILLLGAGIILIKKYALKNKA